MRDEPEADRFVFTNETISGRGCWIGRMVAIGIAALGALGMALPMLLGWLGPARPPGDRANAVDFFALGTYCLVVGVLLWREMVIRTWTMDQEGIDFHDARGQRKCLRWQEVERVRWGGASARFHGRWERVDLPWQVITKGQHREIQRRIRGWLPEFNLPDEEKRRLRSIIIELLTGIFFLSYMYISLRFVIFLGFKMIPMARRLKWDGAVFGHGLMGIWMFLILALIVFIRILVEPTYWHERPTMNSQTTVIPEA